MASFRDYRITMAFVHLKAHLLRESTIDVDCGEIIHRSVEREFAYSFVINRLTLCSNKPISQNTKSEVVSAIRDAKIFFLKKKINLLGQGEYLSADTEKPEKYSSTSRKIYEKFLLGDMVLPLSYSNSEELEDFMEKHDLNPNFR